MPLVNMFLIKNSAGQDVGLSFAPGRNTKTKEELIALLLKNDKEGLVIYVNHMEFIRLDNQWLPMVYADRSYMSRPKDFMGVLQGGLLRKSEGWSESKFKTFWWLWKWKRNRGVGFLEQPTMDKSIAGEYKVYDSLAAHS